MNLVIRALRLNDQPLSEPLLGSFDARGGTIGRSEANTLALPDPERHISRLQAEVVAGDGGYTIRNAGGANAIFLNGRALARGESAKLSHRDELQIGGYLLRVQLEDGNAERTISRAHVAVDARAVGAASATEQRTDPRRMAARPGAVPEAPVMAPMAPVTPAATASSNPFADLVAPASVGAISDPFAFLNAPSIPAPSAGKGVAPAKLPDDFDPFADLDVAVPSAASARVLGAPQDLLASVGASAGRSANIDDAFGLPGVAAAGNADPLAAFMAAASAAARVPGPALDLDLEPSVDPLAMFAPPSTHTPAGPQPAAAFNHTAELQGAYTPPRIVDTQPAADPFAGLSASPVPVPVPAHPAASKPSALPGQADTGAVGPTADALWAAFCTGAGIRVALPQGLTAQQMGVLGQVMREAVDGTLRLMMVRATTKKELRTEVTTIRGRNNNPLKFAPDGQVAMEQLVQPPVRGFMSAPAAMQDAMHDLVGHSIGTMAGMRAALAGVLERFQPGQLEAKLADKSILDNLLAMNRKAKLWDLYLQHFDTIRGEAQDDFHTLFGRAFVAAYEDQLDRLPQRSDPA